MTMKDKKLDNPVQQQYYEDFQQIWASGIDDWHDMNNFMIALLVFTGEVFKSFSHWTEQCFTSNWAKDEDA